MPPPVAVVVVATIAGLAAIAAFTEFVYKPHIHPEVARWLEERRRRRQQQYAQPHPAYRGDGPPPRPPRNRGRGRDDSDDDDDSHPLLNSRPPLSPRSRQPQQRASQPGTPGSMRTRVDSDEERYGAPFDSRRRPQPRDNIELADLAPEVREWRRHDMEDAVTLRRRNVGHTSPTGSVGTLGGVDRASAFGVTPRPSGTAVVHEPTRPQGASNPFLPYTPYRPRARGSPSSTTTTTPSPVSATPVATGAATTTIRSPPPSRLPAPAAPRVERHNLETSAPTHVISDPDEYSPISGSANTTAPGTPHMASNSILRGSQLYPQLQQQAVVEPTSGSMLLSRDGHGLNDHGRREQEQQGAGQRSVVVGTTGTSTDGTARARPTSPAHTDLSSLLTSPPLRTLPAITGTTTPLAPVPIRVPITRISGLDGSNAATPRGPTVVQVERTSPALHRSTGSSPSSATLASFQTATAAVGSPPYSPSSIVSSGLGGRTGSGMRESLDTLTTPVQASYSHSSTSSPTHRSPTHPGAPGESTLISGYIPSLSQTYHPQDLDYERGVVLLSPPSSRSESPFSVVSNTGSPGSRSPALSTGTNYMSLDGSVDGRITSAGFGRSPLVPLVPQHTSGPGAGTGPGSPVQVQTHANPPHSPPSSITFDDSDFDLLSATNSPYSMSPFASPHIGTIRHSTAAAGNNNINANAMSPPMIYHQLSPSRSGSGPHSPTGHRPQNNINITHGSPALQRATSPTTSTTSTSISDIDFLDDDDSFGFNSDGWVSDHNQPSRR